MTAAALTAMVLAGGRGSRMGGVDKGLQVLHGQTLVEHTLERLRAQRSVPGVSPSLTLAINANRHLDDYARLGLPVWPDADGSFAGPLAGFLAGLTHCATPWLLTVPCDTPHFPLDLAARLLSAAQAQDADIAMAAGLEADGQSRTQPVFCLMRQALQPALAAFLAGGGRKVDAWTARHRCITVSFDDAGPEAFFNANTPADLHALQAPGR